MNIQGWFQHPVSTLTYDYNKPELTRGLMGCGQPEPVPPPQKLYDLGAYRTPFSWLWRRPRNVLQGR